MSLRQLRARLDRLQARFPEGDEESIARARYDYLHGKPWYEITAAERSEYSGLCMSLLPHLPPAATDEERAARARYKDLRRRAGSFGTSERLEALTEAEQIEYDELTFRYHFMGESIKFFKEHAKKVRAEEEERSRLRQLGRQKQAAAAARVSSEADSSYCPDGTGTKETSRFRQVERKRQAAAAVRISYEDDSDCWPIDDDDL
jgi:hypothetical protein